jgi:hypothetical protein
MMRCEVCVDGPRRVMRRVMIVKVRMGQRQVEGHRLNRDAQHGRRELADHPAIVCRE